MGVFIGIVVIVFIIALFAKSGKCDVCSLPFKNKYYNWTIEGKKQKLCPKCSQQMERRVSKAAFKSKFG
ncbi:MAG: hypothetical protein JF599_00430 [Verrucomicrobia bacterium]|nr:hypothetical protein [Verrucomicrobiota bacterium]